MAWLGVPWAVGGGAELSPAVARLLAFAATGGAEGVAGIYDLKVTALPVPGTSIRTTFGGAVILNRSPGAANQSYVGMNATSTDVPVTPTGAGSARYDLVVARVMDPEYPPWPEPADPVNGPYIETHIIENVSSTTRTAAQLNLGYPAIALARLSIPASTATITNAMITDLREVAIPRRVRYVRTMALGGSSTEDLTSSTDEAFPNASLSFAPVDIPEWATAARVTAMWSQAMYGPNLVHGTVYARIGGGASTGTADPKVDTQTVGFRSPDIASPSKTTVMLMDDIAIPSSMRGTTQVAHLRGRRVSAESGAYFRLDDLSSIGLDIEFLESASLA